ncbi:MAG: hypothetical protein ACLGQW_03625, partial [Acidobacteriota bacterium]
LACAAPDCLMFFKYIGQSGAAQAKAGAGAVHRGGVAGQFRQAVLACCFPARPRVRTSRQISSAPDAKL